MVGRDVERQAVLAKLDGLSSGRGGLVVLTGEAGIGKSRLARELTGAAAARGDTTLFGRANAVGRSQAYRPIAGAVSQAVRALPIGSATELDTLRPCLANLLPSLVDGPRVALSPMLVAETILRLTRLTGDTVLVLEDLHWADAETLAVLDYLADYLDDASLLVAATARSERALDMLCAQWASRDVATVVRLGRLSTDDARTMIRQCAGDRDLPDSTVDQIERRSDGIPFLIEELLIAVEPGTPGAAVVVPPSFAHSVADRLAVLGPQATRILTTASVLGREVDWELVRDTTGESTAAVLETLARAIGCGLIDELPGGQMRFRHALTADAIRATMVRPQLINLAGELLDQLVADPVSADRLPVCAELAILSDRGPDACRHLTGHARNALAAGSVSTAIATAERAVALIGVGTDEAIDSGLVLLAALDTAGDSSSVMRTGLSLLDGLRGNASSAEVLLYLARASARSADQRSAREFCERGLRVVEPGTELKLALRLSLAEIAFDEQRHDEAVTLAVTVLREADAVGAAQPACAAQELLGRHNLLIVNRLSRAHEHFTDVLRRAQETRLDVFELRALHQLAYLDLARFGGRAQLDDASAKAERMGALAIAVDLEQLRAIMHMTAHELDAATACAERALESARRYRLTEQVATLIGLLASCEAMANKPDLANARIDAELRTTRYAPHLRATISGSASLLAALVRDDLPEALRCVQRTRELLSTNRVVVQPLFLGLFHAIAAVVVAASEDQELREGGDWVDIDDAFMSSSFAVARAIVAGRAGDHAHAEALFERGDVKLGGAPLIQALLRMLAGRAARSDGWGDPDRLSGAAASFFVTCGIPQLATACSRRADPVTDIGMTSRETEVLTLLCTGLTNQQIAARLYLSPRTVEKHVERLLQKTQAANRTELAAIALRNGHSAGR
jgi:DNA-binding CsgD family transcriptional regulator